MCCFWREGSVCICPVLLSNGLSEADVSVVIFCLDGVSLREVCGIKFPYGICCDCFY